MTKFIVEVHRYPEAYEVEAGTKEEAKAKALERFYAEGNSGVYETVVEEN